MSGMRVGRSEVIGRLARRRHARRLAGRLDGLAERALAELASSPPGPVVFVVANTAYAAVLDNWLAAMRRLPPARILVVALDRPLADRLCNEGIPTLLVEHGADFAAVVTLRVAVLRRLVDGGLDVIQSDIDAIWLRDPIPEIVAGWDSFDLVASAGTIHPTDVHDRWGFVLCNGLFGLRAGAAAERLLAEWEPRVRPHTSDQASLNRVLAARGVDWTVPSPYEIEFRDRRLRCSDDLIVGQAGDLGVAVLPFRRFPRLAEYGVDPCVVHPLIPKRQPDKIRVLAELGLWFASDRTVAPPVRISRRPSTVRR